MKSVVRSFIAVDLAPSIRSEIDKATRRLALSGSAVKWVAPEQFHVTLKFLGDVPMTEIYQVIRAVEAACRGVEPFDLVFAGLGAFPNIDSPRTLWVGVTEGVEEIRALVDRLDAEFAKQGYPKEARRFTPHLTLGRTRGSDRPEKEKISLPENAVPAGENELRRLLLAERETFFGAVSVDAVRLYSSELSRLGPKYEVLSEIELKN